MKHPWGDLKVPELKMCRDFLSCKHYVYDETQDLCDGHKELQKKIKALFGVCEQIKTIENITRLSRGYIYLSKKLNWESWDGYEDGI